MFIRKLAHHAMGHSHEVLVGVILEADKLHYLVVLGLTAALIVAFALQVLVLEKGL